LLAGFDIMLEKYIKNEQTKKKSNISSIL